MSAPRKPAAFRVEPQPVAPPAQKDQARMPRALSPEGVVVADEIDVFDQLEQAADVPPPPVALPRRSWLGRIFWGASGALLSLALWLWAERLVRDLFQREEWLGWLAGALAVAAAAALAAILLREALAVARLASVEKLRGRALEAIARNDPKSARSVVSELVAAMTAKPETAAGRRALAQMQDDVIDGADFIAIAERELLSPLDLRARTLVLDAAKRVSVVTAVSPRAFVDLAYVLFESGRLIRRLSELYGARPGTLGFFRLIRSVLAHLAVTGAIAAGDDLVHQIVGQGLAARLSAKLGEGVLNGTMTARIGIAAIEATRPLPFHALKRPGLSDFLKALTAFSSPAKT